MPGIEKENVGNPEPGSQPEAGDGQEQPVPPEEATLTDRLNKKLLTSFLERINNTGFQINSEEQDNASSSNDFYNEFL